MQQAVTETPDLNEAPPLLASSPPAKSRGICQVQKLLPGLPAGRQAGHTEALRG